MPRVYCEVLPDLKLEAGLGNKTKVQELSDLWCQNLRLFYGQEQQGPESGSGVPTGSLDHRPKPVLEPQTGKASQ